MEVELRRTICVLQGEIKILQDELARRTRLASTYQAENFYLRELLDEDSKSV